MNGDGNGPHPKVTMKLFIGGLLFGRKVERALLDATRDEFTPEGVPPMDRRAEALLEAAFGLAGDVEWGDDDAVAELKRLAGRHRGALRVAEINSRSGGDHRVFEIENRAQRILEAAVSGRPVRSLKAQERRLLKSHEDDPDEEYAGLVCRLR